RLALALELLELARQRRDQQVHLGGEVAVEGADGHIGALGNGSHLDRVVAALRREGEGRVEDALAALPLRSRTQLVLAQRGDRRRTRGGWLSGGAGHGVGVLSAIGFSAVRPSSRGARSSRAQALS